MLNISSTLSAIIATIGGAISWVLGGFDILLLWLLIIMVLDILTGLTESLYFKCSPKTNTGRFASSVFRVGLLHKGAILMVVVISVMVDHITGLGLVRDIVVTFYLLEEAMSCLENLARCGLPLPKKLTDVLEVLQDKNDNIK